MRRLLERIHNDEDGFYISVFTNHQTGSLERWREELRAFEGDNFAVESKYANGWGAFSLVRATLDGMEHFRDRGYDYFLNLSGQCYPLKTVKGIKSTLARDPRVGYMECNPLPWDRWVDEGGGFDRIYRSWYKPFKSLNKMSIPRRKRELPLRMKPYGGSQWFAMPRRHTDYVLDLLSEHPELTAFWERTLIPDELFFQTIMMNSPYKEHISRDDNLRFIDWHKRCVPLPAILLSEDLPRLMASDKLFARKFDPKMDGQVLDQIDRRALGRSG